MNIIITIIIFGLCIFGLALGLIFSNKTLKKGCSTNPEDCGCLNEGKDPSACDDKNK